MEKKIQSGNREIATREIKFRHFDPNYKEMTPFQQIRLLPSDKKFSQLFKQDSDGGFLMQFTGLKDKNGVEIYEGDIIQKFIETGHGEVKKIYTVIFDYDGFCLLNRETYAFGFSRDGRLLKEEVIGNIHETPELLTK